MGTRTLKEPTYADTLWSVVNVILDYLYMLSFRGGATDPHHPQELVDV